MCGRVKRKRGTQYSGVVDQPSDYLMYVHVLSKNPRLSNVRRGLADPHMMPCPRKQPAAVLPLPLHFMTPTPDTDTPNDSYQ